MENCLLCLFSLRSRTSAALPEQHEENLGFPWEKIAPAAGRVGKGWFFSHSCIVLLFLLPALGLFTAGEPGTGTAVVSPGCVCGAAPAAMEARGNPLPRCRAALCFATGWDQWIPALGDKSRLRDSRDLSRNWEQVRNWCPACRRVVEGTEGTALPATGTLLGKAGLHGATPRVIPDTLVPCRHG